MTIAKIGDVVGNYKLTDLLRFDDMTIIVAVKQDKTNRIVMLRLDVTMPTCNVVNDELTKREPIVIDDSQLDEHNVNFF